MSDLQIKLGKLLQAERERQNRPLADLSTELKIPEQHLLAIEEGDLGALPSALYFKLFAKSYAEALGIDYTKALDIMREEGEEIGEETRPAGAPATPQRPIVRPRQPEPKSGKAGLWILFGLFVIVLAGVAWFVFLKGDGVAGDAGASDTTQVAESEESDSEYVSGITANREESAIDLDLMARDRTWAVVIADGDTAIQTNLKPWREYFIGAQESLIVSIGSPLAVDIMLNGEMANLSNPEDGSISSVIITPENAVMFVQRGFTDSTDTIQNSDDTTGTGSSSATQGPVDTASLSRGTPDGT